MHLKSQLDITAAGVLCGVFLGAGAARVASRPRRKPQSQQHRSQAAGNPAVESAPLHDQANATYFTHHPPPPATKRLVSHPVPKAGPVTRERLGRATWTLLHTLSSEYPDAPSRQLRSDARSLARPRRSQAPLGTPLPPQAACCAHTQDAALGTRSSQPPRCGLFFRCPAWRRCTRARSAARTLGSTPGADDARAQSASGPRTRDGLRDAQAHPQGPPPPRGKAAPPPPLPPCLLGASRPLPRP